jgi:hypothetical protein
MVPIITSSQSPMRYPMMQPFSIVVQSLITAVMILKFELVWRQMRTCNTNWISSLSYWRFVSYIYIHNETALYTLISRKNIQSIVRRETTETKEEQEKVFTSVWPNKWTDELMTSLLVHFRYSPQKNLHASITH